MKSKLRDLLKLGEKIHIEVEGREYIRKFFVQAKEEGFTDGTVNLSEKPKNDKGFFVLTQDLRVFDGDIWYKQFSSYTNKKENNDPDTVVVDYNILADGSPAFIKKYVTVKKEVHCFKKERERRLISLDECKRMRDIIFEIYGGINE